MPEPTEHHAAVVVFVRVHDAVSERDANHVAYYAVAQRLSDGGRGGTPVEIPVKTLRGQETVTVADVQELPEAMGNGFLRVRPSGQAFRFLDREDS